MAKWLLAGWLLIGAAIIVAAWVFGQQPLPLDPSPLPFIGQVLPSLGLWILIFVVPATIAITDAVLLWMDRDLNRLRRSALTVKVAGVPYFALIGLVIFSAIHTSASVAYLAGGLPPHPIVLLAVTVGLFFGAVVAPIFLLIGYLTFLPTAAYGIAALALLRSDRAISRVRFVVNVVLQLLCLADLVSTVLVIIGANKVISTRTLSLAEAEQTHPDLYQRYDELEGLAARRAAERCTAADRSRLVALHGRLLGARTAGHYPIAGHLARAFHERIWTISGSTMLRRDLQEATTSFWANQAPPPLVGDGSHADSVGEHEVILRAITEHRPDDAERAVREHLRDLRRPPVAPMSGGETTGPHR